MKHLFLLTIMIITVHPSFSQQVMKVEDAEINNACDPENIYFLTKDRAEPSEVIDSIENRLNREIDFAKKHPDFKEDAAIQFAVNCKGEVGGGFHMINKTGNDELDQELMDFFRNVKKWKAGKLKRKNVDCWYMWRLRIEDGHIDILNS